MNANDQELTFAVARDVMGWTPLDDIYSLHATATTGVFKTTDRVSKAEFHLVRLPNHSTPYQFYWNFWNPIGSANDYMEIVDRLFAQGHRVVLSSKGDKFTCSIIHGQFEDDLFVRYDDASRGRAICIAALMFFEECKKVSGKLSPTDRLKALLKIKLHNAELPAIYRWAAVDESGDCYAWPLRPGGGLHAWINFFTDEEKVLGVLKIPDGVRWQDLIVDLEEAPAAKQECMVTASF